MLSIDKTDYSFNPDDVDDAVVSTGGTIHPKFGFNESKTLFASGSEDENELYKSGKLFVAYGFDSTKITGRKFLKDACADSVAQLSSKDIVVPPTVYGVAVGNVNPDVSSITFKGDDDKMRFVKLALTHDEKVEIGANLTKLNLAFDTKEGVANPAKITLDLSQATALKELKIVGDLKNVMVKDASNNDVTLESLVNNVSGTEIDIGGKTFTFTNTNNVLSLMLNSSGKTT